MQIAILDDYQHVALAYPYWETLPADVHVVPFHEHLADPDDLVARLEPFPIVVAMRERTRLPRSVLERLPRLRLLVTTGMGNAAIDLDAARDLGVTVCGTDAVGESTVELTWALILTLLRRLPDQAIHGDGWQTGRGRSALGGDLAGSALGVVGFGRLGTRVATVGAAFGMRVMVASESTQADEVAALGYEPVTREDLLRAADIVTLHLRLTDRTRGIIGAAELAMMRPTAYLVNTSRGPLVDEAALIDAVRSGWIAGAGLDVYDTEPLPAGHPLRDLPNTVLTPHLGYVSKRTYEVFHKGIVEDIAAYLAGSPIRVIT